jgi:hypothetical protein
MKSIDLDKALSKLLSNDYLTTIEGLDELIDIFNHVSEVIINVLIKNSDSLFIAERVFSLNELLFKRLNDLFYQSTDEDLKFNIALILFEKKFQYPLIRKYLIDTLKSSDISKISLAISKLASANDDEIFHYVVDRITEMNIINLNFDQIDMVVILLDNLRKLTDKIPVSILPKLLSPDLPWQIKASLSEFINSPFKNEL